MKLQVTGPMTFRIKGGQLLHRYRAKMSLRRSLFDANKLEIPYRGSSNGLKEVMIRNEQLTAAIMVKHMCSIYLDLSTICLRTYSHGCSLCWEINQFIK